ncbi:Serine/threonine-protein phosphatase 5 [Tetrabaena socialis]|uniref:Serine/threonine-protein phosphatase 5 n=1 Tax=Tetrabaena socialis TaxID=47790 RepID=A0A2J7ZWU5_9CHLO|nr:Serine/threonine-protein phosphatase 5 [Tetrabaena socialis]|eukprot:PNH04734.1 Serine/threonine-protein phosphatase 5 [Tetrabaena socialis]
MNLRSIALGVVLACLAERSLASTDVSQLLKQGDAALANSEFSSAVKFYTAAIAQQPSAPLLYTKRAAAHLSLHQPSQALRDLDKAVELDGSFVQGLINRGKLQRQMCSFAAAERDFSRVLELKPGQKVAEAELRRAREAQAKYEALEAAVAAAAERHAAAEAEGQGASVAGRDMDRLRFSFDRLYEDAADCVKVGPSAGGENALCGGAV